MPRTIELKSTGETITFTKSGTDTAGQSVETIVCLVAPGEGPPLHSHARQTEIFEALEGPLALECNGEKVVLAPGQKYTVPPNAMHRCYSADGTTIRFKATFTPALNIEYILSEVFESSNRNKTGMPSKYDGSYILQQTKGEYFLGGIPTFVQKTIFPATAVVGKMLGKVKATPLKKWNERA